MTIDLDQEPQNDDIDPELLEFFNPTPAPKRPLRPLTPANLEALLWAQCTAEECAAFFGLRESELMSHINASHELMRVYELAPIAGRAVLKRRQFIAAQAGDAKMLSHLGEQVLGQIKKTEVNITLEKVDQMIAELESQVGGIVLENAIDVEEITDDQSSASKTLS